jgi:hypothetical protein
MRDVDIVAGGDGSGVIGLDLSFSEFIGPAFFSRIRVDGFDFGIKAANWIHPRFQRHEIHYRLTTVSINSC